MILMNILKFFTAEVAILGRLLSAAGGDSAQTGQLQSQLHLPQRVPKQLVLVVLAIVLPACPLPLPLPIQAILILGIGNGLVGPAARDSYPPFVVVGQQLLAPTSKTHSGLAALVPGEFGPSGVGAAVFQMGLRRSSGGAAVPQAAECPT